jgi:two-component sensor histidine kinase
VGVDNRNRLLCPRLLPELEPLADRTACGSDFLIFASYTAIPVAILIFVSRRKDLELKGLAWFFAAFILWCGLTHLLGMVTLWLPIYDVQALVKAATAAVSVPTAVLIFLLLPKALAIPSPRELQRVNDQLREEIAAHQRTLAELEKVKAGLEQRVQERTHELASAAEHARILVREIAHRAGNVMSVVSAMARLSLRMQDEPEQFVSQFVGRLEGMGRSHDLLLQNQWQDLSLEVLAESQLRPFLGERPLEVSGPALTIGPSAAHHLGMAFYELATNSTKYGALSVPEGRVNLSWSIHQEEQGQAVVELIWREFNGPPVSEPKRTGWGTTVLTTLAAGAINGKAELHYLLAGLMWRLRVPSIQSSAGNGNGVPA